MRAEDNPTSAAEVEQIRLATLQELITQPPTIGVIGTSGTGKSSTVNAMFNTSLPVSNVVACTKVFRDVNLELRLKHGQAAGQRAVLRIVDAPGLGEDASRDSSYLEMYQQHLPRCDAILWVMAARNRGVALDQQYLRALWEFQDRIVFGINQIDLVEPLDWMPINLPSRQQEDNIGIIVQDRKAKLEDTLGTAVQIVPYSASKRYGLQELFTALIERSSGHRGWILAALKAFEPDDFVPEELRDEIRRMGKRSRR
jgi:predicted GTPase